jgi:hypothetical protein
LIYAVRCLGVAVDDWPKSRRYRSWNAIKRRSASAPNMERRRITLCRSLEVVKR